MEIPPKRYTNGFKRIAGTNWQKLVLNRTKQKQVGEAYVSKDTSSWLNELPCLSLDTFLDFQSFRIAVSFANPRRSQTSYITLYDCLYACKLFYLRIFIVVEMIRFLKAFFPSIKIIIDTNRLKKEKEISGRITMN